MHFVGDLLDFLFPALFIFVFSSVFLFTDFNFPELSYFHSDVYVFLELTEGFILSSLV